MLFPVLSDPKDTEEVRKALLEMQRQIEFLSTGGGASAPTASVMQYAGTTAPAGWLLCDGSAVSRAQYPELNKIMRDVGGVGAYGWGVGDGSTTFNLPNFQNIVPYGANSSTRTIAGVVHPATPLGTTHNDRIQGHYHAARSPTSNFFGSGAGTNNVTGPSPAATVLTTGSPATDGTNGTPRTGATTMAAGVGINFIIKT